MSGPVTRTAPEPAVATQGLTKRFGERTVVDAVDLSVPTGAVYGFLGPNGSGKTTTIRMLLGLIGADAGSRELLGVPIPQGGGRVLHRVGALVEGPAFHPYLSGRANLARLDAADRHADPATAGTRIDAVLDRVGLLAAARKRYRAYSLGMRQRLAIAATLLQPRDLLVLDEPTNGLDPQGTREVRTLLGGLADDGATVLVSSHLLAEVQQVCTHVGVMHRGRLVAQDRIDAVRGAGEALYRIRTADPHAATAALDAFGLDDVAAAPVGQDGYALVTADPGASSPENVVAALVGAGVGVAGFEVSRPSLEDLFVALTGEGFDVGG